MGLIVQLSFVLIHLLAFPLLASPHRARNVCMEIKSDTSRVEAVEGYNASLPCAIRAPPRDSPVLTLWYIGTEETPVYSYDQRSFASPSSWADGTIMGSRAVFLAGEVPPILLLVNVSRDDAKTYRCRVDYNYSNSRVAWVKLSVVVPPRRILVEPQLSPVEAGQMNDVVCKVIAGSPQARVVWLQKGEVVDESYSISGHVSMNSLDVPAKREDLEEVFTCTGNNNDLSTPLVATYLRNVTCGPSSVAITTEDAGLVEDRITRFFCTVLGSNPQPRVSWFLQNNQLTKYVKTVALSNKTVSRIDLHLTKVTNKNELICRARNPLLPRDTLEDIMKLNVAYKPRVSLTLGRSLDPKGLKEGNDVFFECEVDSNPPPYKVEWYHKGSPLVHNVSLGILMSEKTLALQRVVRERSGEYRCSASNVEGDAFSNDVTMNILYAPRCVVPPSLRGIALGELTNVTCVVDADPQPVSFKWEFNNSVRKDSSEPVSQRKYTDEGLKSTLSYTPLSERDYGTLFCLASNSVGTQKEPCSFTVISAGPPEPVSNCSVSDLTSHSVSVTCQQGFDGGLPQRFLLQILETRNGTLVWNSTGSSAKLSARPLESGTSFYATVVAYNSRGRGPPTPLKFITLKEAAMHKILPSKVEPSPLVWGAGVIFSAILTAALLLVALWRVKRRHLFLGAERASTITTVMRKDNNPDLIIMDGSEDKLTDSEEGNETDSPPTKNLGGQPQRSLGHLDNPFHSQGQRSHQESHQGVFQSNHVDVNETSLCPSPSPDVNERTRLTSPIKGRRPPRKEGTPRCAVTRLSRTPNLGPESTF